MPELVAHDEVEEYLSTMVYVLQRVGPSLYGCGQVIPGQVIHCLDQFILNHVTHQQKHKLWEGQYHIEKPQQNTGQFELGESLWI